MSILLDSGNINEIKKYLNMGIIRGVTTNPTILLKDGLSGDFNNLKDYLYDIAKLIDPYPLSIEVLSNERNKMISQAKEFSDLAKNVVIKIPIHGPNGELDNLSVIKELESDCNIRVNVTAMMSAQQCFIASLIGASYVSIFGGRVNNMGYNVCNEILKLRKLIDLNHLKSKIIVGSTREVLNIIEWLDAGAHFVTVTPNLISGLIIHPYTKETVKTFLEDASKILISS